MTFETFIPPRSKSVLEVTGKVDADFENTRDKFLEIQPACDYSVEENFSGVEGKFDTILIQSQLIGKLENAELVALIKSAAEKLNKRGTIIFALDNIGFAENITAILEGKPLKFKVTLSKVELEDAIETAGLNEFRTLFAARRVPVARSIAETAKIDVAVFAHIISATPDELPPKTIIQTAVGEKIVCAPIRIYTPNSFLLTEPGISTTSYEDNAVYRFFDAEQFGNRIFINQRRSFPTFARAVEFFRQVKEHGYLSVNEMDDHPVLWEKDYAKTGFVNFAGVHAVQTTTEYLADYLRQYNPNVKVFANHLKHLLPLRDFDKPLDRPVTIFFGALNRDKDFNEILPIINQFAAEYGDKLAFKVIAKTGLFESIESKNKTLLGDPNYYDGQFIPYERYEEELRGADIALLPLLDNKFNRGKSDLKFVECAGCGAVALASPVAYSKSIDDGKTGLIFYDTTDFANKLRLLIDNPDKRREIATAAYEYVKHNRLLSQHYEERLDWYLELLAKLPELNAETQARIDKLAPQFKDEKPEQIPPPPPEGFSPRNAEIVIPDSVGSYSW